MSTRWTANDIPDLSGKVAIVTGGNIGLGYRTSLELARKGAQVCIACRSVDKGEAAIARIREEVPEAQLSTLPLDLVDLDSVRGFAEAFRARSSRLDILVNNAGVVMLEGYQLSPAGQEMHMATNHLGHFALTGLLFELLRDTDGARVVTVSSGAYVFGVIDFEDFDWKKRKYSKGKAYGDSKLANLLFMAELQRRFEAAGCSAISVAAHPGLSATERHDGFTGLKGLFDGLVASPMEEGVLPQLRAATDPEVRPRDYYGPRFGLRGAPKKVVLKGSALDAELAKRLWSYSQELTGQPVASGAAPD